MLQYILLIFEWCRIQIGKIILQLTGIIKTTIFRILRTETVLKMYYTLVLPTFLYGLENWTLTALQRRRIEAAEMKLLRPLAGYILYDHKTDNYIRRELRITGILDKIGEYRQDYTCQKCHKTESLWNHTTTDREEGEHLEDRRNVGESSCNFGNGTDQRVQS